MGGKGEVCVCVGGGGALWYKINVHHRQAGGKGGKGREGREGRPEEGRADKEGNGGERFCLYVLCVPYVCLSYHMQEVLLKALGTVCVSCKSALFEISI